MKGMKDGKKEKLMNRDEKRKKEKNMKEYEEMGKGD